LPSLIVVLYKTIDNTGLSEGGILNTLKSVSIFMTGGTSDNSEKETQIKVLSRRRVSIIHPANLNALLPGCPDTPLPVPDHDVRKVLVEGATDGGIIMIKSIGRKPSSKCGVPVLIALKSLLKSVPVGMNDNCLLLGKMNCQTQNTGLMILNFKEVKTPVGLTAADIARIQVKLDLILGSAKLHGGAIMALVDILVDVLDSFDKGDRLHIDVTPILPDEILAVTDDPSVVNLIFALWTCSNGLPSIETSGPGIGVFSDAGALIEGLGKSFGAFAILHAG
jgi:hypothetical protein